MGNSPWRTAVIGVAHMHIKTIAGHFAACDDFNLTAVADLPPSRPSVCEKPDTRPFLVKKIGELANGNIYEDWRVLLEKEKPEVVLCCAENARHGAFITELLSRGIHVVVEKPMAGTYGEAKLMAYAAKNAGVRLLINWPSSWNPANRLAKELIDAGAVGKVFRFQYRNSSSLGPHSYNQGLTDDEKSAEWWYRLADRGGAYWDYCCYGANMSRWFLGADAISVQAMCANFATPYAETEDFGAILAQYPSAAAIIEGTWTTLHSGFPAGPIVHGLEGALVVDSGDVKIYKERSKYEPTETHTP
ncbi:MAG: Gfo/Idh/MocA family oxidoreductase, partial [Oscillospiraceae bacterium]|nr:Gfo/Idh/MocA family oxidoreductase [Oscillospiraceae bacterium]